MRLPAAPPSIKPPPRRKSGPRQRAQCTQRINNINKITALAAVTTEDPVSLKSPKERPALRLVFHPSLNAAYFVSLSAKREIKKAAVHISAAFEDIYSLNSRPPLYIFYFLTDSGSLSSGSGGLKRYPWYARQPISSSASMVASFSTYSAMTLNPSERESPMMEAIISRLL